MASTSSTTATGGEQSATSRNKNISNNDTANNSSSLCKSVDGRVKNASILIAITEGFYAREQENVGFLTLVLRAVQSLVHTSCYQQEVHVFVPPAIQTTESQSEVNRRSFLVFSEWENEEHFQAHGADMTDANEENDSRVPQEVAFAVDSSNIIGDSDMEDGESSSMASSPKTSPAAIFEAVKISLWQRLDEQNDGMNPMHKPLGRAFASHVATLCIRPKNEAECTSFRLQLIGGRDLTLREPGCVSFQVLVKRASEEESENSQDAYEDAHFMVYAVFVSVRHFELHVQQKYSFFNSKNNLLTSSNVESSQADLEIANWRRADFPTAPKSETETDSQSGMARTLPSS